MVSAHIAVLGSPIEHSKSPAIHAAAYLHLGLNWDYGKYRVEASELRHFLKLRNASWRGFSLTMPLKEEAFRISKPSCPNAVATGVVNTLLHTEDGWEGFNTDVFGISQAVSMHSKSTQGSISILGSGATATSAVVAARHLNPAAELTIYARRKTSVLGLQTKPLEEFYADPNSDLTISTLPGSVQHPNFAVREDAQILDVAYNPWPSKLASNWSQGGRISGLEMLLWQALVQVRIFRTGDGSEQLPNELEVFEAMRAAVKL